MVKTIRLRGLMFRISTFIGVALVTTEIIVRIYLGLIAPASVFNRYASLRGLEARYGANFLAEKTRYTPHRYLGYIPTPRFQAENGDRHNALGYRGEEFAVPKPEATYRVVILGGSTTYGFGVPHYDQTFPFLLQRRLRDRGHPNIEVVNGGASSYSSWESLANLAFRVLDLEPDLILVYHGTNDAALRMVWPKAAYRGDNSGARDPWLGRPRHRPLAFELSAALRMLAVNLGWIPSPTALSEHWDKRAATYYSDAFTQQQRSHSYPGGIFRDTPAEEMMKANAPIFFERNLRNLVSIAATNRVETVLLTFAYSSLFPDEPRVNHPVYTRAMDEGNAIVRKVADETPARLYDFASVMPDDTRYFTDGRHFTREGNELRAEVTANFLIDARLLGPNASSTATEQSAH